MPVLSDVEQAVYHTVAYADIFNYPLRTTELQRYLIGVQASLDEVYEAVGKSTRKASLLETDGYISLPNRRSIIDVRRRRAIAAQQLWTHARYYGLLIGNLPFVRMVAVTGSLAVDNAEVDADIDYMIVTEPGRLWLCRLFVIAIVKWARHQGVALCPNYFVSENVLRVEQRNLFTAHEIVQMVPLTGFAVYDQIRRQNQWTDEYVPNALGFPPERTIRHKTNRPFAQRTAEIILRSPLGGWLDRWEMRRKIRKLMEQGGSLEEVDFSPDTCKGHFDAHQKRILNAYHQRIRRLEPVYEPASAD